MTLRKGYLMVSIACFIIAIIALALLLTSCAGPARIPQGPLSWQDGYRDGYESGQAAAGYVYAHFKKDFRLFKLDEDYKMGWDDGFQAGKGAHESTQRMLGPVFR